MAKPSKTAQFSISKNFFPEMPGFAGVKFVLSCLCLRDCMCMLASWDSLF